MSDRIIAKFPDNENIAKLLRDVADCYIQTGALSEAADVVDGIFRDHSTNADFKGILCDIEESYRENGHYEESLEMCWSWLDSSAGTDEQLVAYVGIARAYSGLGDDSNVNETLDIICADFADHKKLGWAVFVIGEEYYLRGQDDRLRRPDPNSDDKWPKAVAIWQKVLDTPISDDLYNARASFFTGICYTHMKDDEAAIGVLEHVLQTWPDFEYAWNAQSWIGDCYMRLKKAGKIPPAQAEAQAEQAYKAVLEKYPDCPIEEYVYWRLSAMMYRQQRWDEAAMFYELFLSLKPNDARLPVIRFNLGQCYEKLGDTEMALATYRLVLTSHPEQKKNHSKATERIAVLEGGVK